MAAPRPRLFLHDSQQHKRVAFEPLDGSHVRVYFCGPTVYDLVHIGNLRALMVGDILVRVLRVLYPRVTYVRNITDVDDKINARARENGEPISALTARTIADFRQDMAAMSVLPPDIEPQATHNIGQMQDIITRLITQGYAYEAKGHVLFSVAAFDAYGALSGRRREDMIAGARVEVAPYKRDPGDFVLWKPSEGNEPGWDSPWGYGRPGWHIECSAMSYRYLGESFDIHGGGSDLLFPHHENERAQSLCCFSGSTFARYWVHNAMLLVDGEKMSKSLGNFFTVREILARHPAEALRLFLLRSHYRSVLNFTQEGLVESKKMLDRFYRAIVVGAHAQEDIALSTSFLEALCDDLNTPQAIAILHTLADAALAGDAEAAQQLRVCGRLLGLLGSTAEAWFQAGVDEDRVNALVQERLEARKRRDFERADEIRQALLEEGIILEDGAGGTEWRRA